MTEPTSAALGPTTDLASFVAVHGDALVRFAYVLCRDPERAQDLTQTALAATVQRDFSSIDAPLAYVRRAIVHSYLNEERRKPRAQRALGLVILPALATSSFEDRLGERDALRASLAGLPARHRTVLVLRYFLDLDEAQISEVMGVRPSSVRSLLTRARRHLRTVLEDKADD